MTLPGVTPAQSRHMARPARKRLDRLHDIIVPASRTSPAAVFPVSMPSGSPAHTDIVPVRRHKRTSRTLSRFPRPDQSPGDPAKKIALHRLRQLVRCVQPRGIRLFELLHDDFHIPLAAFLDGFRAARRHKSDRRRPETSSRRPPVIHITSLFRSFLIDPF